MGLLTGKLNNIIREDTKNYGYTQDQVCLNSDFTLFDYLNGSVDIRKDGSKFYKVGVESGKSIMIVGKPGSGKSSFGIQLAASIMKKYDESTLIIYDFEQSHSETRIKSLTGMTDEYFNDHVTIKSTGIYTESVLKLIKQIAEFKKENEKQLLIENKEGVKDSDGNLVKILPPTIVFVDSLASMRTKDSLNTDDMASLTAGARNAVSNKDFYNKILQPCVESNIVFIAINHINDNPAMGVTPPSAMTRYLKNTEAISGGKAVLYLSNLLIRIEAGTKLEANEKYGVKGFVASISTIKSRNSEGGKSVDYIFSQKEGFDEDLSEFEYLKANGKIKGAGIGLYLEGHETEKFRMSNIKEKLQNQSFRTAFKSLVLETLQENLTASSKLLSNISEDTDENQVEETTEQATAETEETESAIETADLLTLE